MVPRELESELREWIARGTGSGKEAGGALRDDLLAIGRGCAALPTLDIRSADEILGYDRNGLPE
ncbi:MAG: antitoxin [Planctomycetes bacterium]|nr:antitoxin [Planctomycetota bacterium]